MHLVFWSLGRSLRQLWGRPSACAGPLDPLLSRKSRPAGERDGLGRPLQASSLPEVRGARLLVKVARRGLVPAKCKTALTSIASTGIPASDSRTPPGTQYRRGARQSLRFADLTSDEKPSRRRLSNALGTVAALLLIALSGRSKAKRALYRMTGDARRLAHATPGRSLGTSRLRGGLLHSELHDSFDQAVGDRLIEWELQVALLPRVL